MKQARRLKGASENKRLTAFAGLVYAVVSGIPRGETLSYKEVAMLAGRPLAARAVGNILNKNRDFTHIPCHRVVRSDGFSGGYALGAARKKALLKKEKAP